MIGELLAYALVPVAILATWAYQWLAARVRRWLHDDIRADQMIWWVQDHYRTAGHSPWSDVASAVHRGSVAVPGDVETQPAADSSGNESAAGPSDRANPSRRTAAARTNPATGTLPPVAGPQAAVDVMPPDVASAAVPPGGPGGAGAVVPEPTAPARSAA